jgi:hypothetical protein
LAGLPGTADITKLLEALKTIKGLESVDLKEKY